VAQTLSSDDSEAEAGAAMEELHQEEASFGDNELGTSSGNAASAICRDVVRGLRRSRSASRRHCKRLEQPGADESAGTPLVHLISAALPLEERHEPLATVSFLGELLNVARASSMASGTSRPGPSTASPPPTTPPQVNNEAVSSATAEADLRASRFLERASSSLSSSSSSITSNHAAGAGTPLISSQTQEQTRRPAVKATETRWCSRYCQGFRMCGRLI